MPSRYPTYMIPPAKGLNLKDDPYRLQAGDLMSGTNIKVSEDGSFERCDGYTDVLTSDIGTTNYCISLTEFGRWDGSIEIFVLYDIYLKKVDPVTWSRSNVYSNMSSDKKIGYVSYGDRLFLGNAYDSNKFIVPIYRHYSERTAISTADATSTASTITLAEALRTDYIAHISSTLQHNAIDGTNVIAAASATDIATCITLVNELRTDYLAHRSQVGIHPSADDYHAVEAITATNAATCYSLVNEIKHCYHQHSGDGRLQQWGITAPVSGATLTKTSGGSLSSGDYYWLYTYYNTVDGMESPPSPAVLTGCNITTSSQVLLTAIGKSTDPQTTHKRIYRTFVNGATYHRVDTITNIDTTYNDTTSDGGLGTILPTEDYTVIPTTNMFQLFNDYIYAAGNLENPQRLYFMQQGYPHFFKATNYFDFAIAITAQAQIPTGLIIFESTRLWYLPGTSPHNFSRTLISDTVGCTNNYGWCSAKGSIFFISRYGVFEFNGSLQPCFSEAINKDLLLKNLDSAALVYDAYNDELRVIVGET